jgi:RNA polymerase sigma-70 factor (ECF subfamily)
VAAVDYRLGWRDVLRMLMGAGGERVASVDPAVVARAQNGDVDAFRTIIDVHDERLRALAFRLTGDRHRMDDAMQEAYVKAFRALPRFKGDASVGTWLYRIVYNACVDELRRRPKVVSLFEAHDVADHHDVGDFAAERADLAAALASLPVDQRAAVMLVDAYGYDYAEAAAVLGVREGTIASRLHRARAALRQSLEAGIA